MKLNIFSYLAAAGAALLGAAGLTGCQDHFDDDVKLETPVAANQPNMTIAEFKAAFWQDDNNYCVEIPAREDGSHYIISGRVISSDYQGNIFKCLYIQDGTAALAMSINQYNLYMVNRVGQELVIDLTGMYAGKYNGMFQLGFPSWYERDQCYETSFMAPELFNAHVEYNGNPEPAKIDTITVSDFSEISDLQKWQGQLVRFNNVTFANANSATDNQLCNEYHSSGYNQALTVPGGSINVRTSGYAKFWNTKLPKEACDVVGILSYYGTQGWQLLLNDADGLMNIGNATQIGTKDKPYTVEEALELSVAGSTTGWVKGYIVGAVAPEVTEVKSDADITWAAPFILDNTVVIAAAPDVRDYSKCIVISLTEGSKLYELGNLADNPERLGKELSVQGRITTSMGMAAITGNSGNASSFELEGVEIIDPANTPGDGTEAAPYTVTQAIALNNPGTSAWVVGYIVGVFNYDNNSALETGTPTTVASCVAIAASPDETDKTKTVAVQLPVGDIRTAVNLKDNPGNLGRVVALQGELVKYFGVAGIKNTTGYKFIGGDTPDVPAPPADGGTEDDPYTIDEVLTLNNPGTTAWVEGYIVGWSSNGAFSANFTAGEDAVASNVLLASSADEKDPAKVVPLQLVSGTDIRTKLNLKDNPTNLGKKLKIEGTLDAFFNRPGIKAPTNYVLE